MNSKPAALLATLIALVVVAAGCGDNAQDAQQTEVEVGVTETTEAVDDTDTTTDTGSDTDTDTSVAGDPSNTSGSDDTASSGTDGWPDGVCTLDQWDGGRFLAVSGIPADDPDGGLNVRAVPEDGERLATLPEGTVVGVEDCLVADDGSNWMAVTAWTADVAGWVNGRYLSSDLPANAEVFGGPETEAAVIGLLDALAAERWVDAAAYLIDDETTYLPLEDLLGDPGEVDAELATDEPVDVEVLADRLAQWCSDRICDAPYEIVEVRGTYRPELARPEVDVRFDYPGGSSVQTFGPGFGSLGQPLADLPGQSVLAMAQVMATATELVADPSALTDDDRNLLAAAEAIRQALLAEDGPGLAGEALSPAGVKFSADAYVTGTNDTFDIIADPILTVDDLGGGDAVYAWGYQDGVGWPIVDTVDGHLNGYRRSSALLAPDVVGIEGRVGLGNTIDNLTDVFPQARVVEFHRQGRGQLAPFNWSSIRMAFEPSGDGWLLVAVTGDTWTV